MEESAVHAQDALQHQPFATSRRAARNDSALTRSTRRDIEETSPARRDDGREDFMRFQQHRCTHSFSRVYARYYAILLPHFCNRLTNPEDAKDACQEVFRRLSNSPDSYDPQRPLGTWILTIANNVLKSEYRTKTRKPSTTFTDLNSATHSDEEDTAPHLSFACGALRPDDEAHLAILRERLKKALVKLDPAHRKVIIQNLILGKTIDEVAERLGVSANTVKSRLRNAKARLRDLLQEYDPALS